MGAVGLLEWPVRVLFFVLYSFLMCFSRRVLLIAYPTGLQIWDCSDLSALREVFDLDLSAAEWALMLGGAEMGG